LLFGLYPAPLLGVLEATVQNIVLPFVDLPMDK
jgi:hypothetical protein